MKKKRMLIWIAVLVILLAAVFWSGPARLRAEKGINRLEQVELGGVKQWISIRGANRDNPVLLFLHGGPGSANIAKLRLQTPELEQHFVVVNWDQRGAGKSFAPWTAPAALTAALTPEQLVSDAHELVGKLQTRFGVQKIYVLGFSWGSALGLSLVEQYPDDCAAFISVSQMVHNRDGERLSLDYVRESAQKAGHAEAIAELAEIEPDYTAPDWQKQLGIQRKWLLHFGGVYHTTNSFAHELGMLLRAPEYSLVEASLWPLGSSQSLKHMWPRLMEFDFFTQAPSVHCPILFLAGRHDYNSPWQLTEAYFEALDAPAGKRLVWFENAAHDIFFDDPAGLTREVLSMLPLSED